MLRPFSREIWHQNNHILKWKESSQISSFASASYFLCSLSSLILYFNRKALDCSFHLPYKLLYLLFAKYFLQVFWGLQYENPATPQSSCAALLFGKSFPRSDQRPWLEFLVLHISRSESLKCCCVVQQIINKGFHAGFWQPVLWPISLLCMLRIFLTANENILFFFQVFLSAWFSSQCKSCLLKQHIHSPLQAPISLICQLQNHGNRRKEARCRIHQNTIYSFLLDQSEQGVCGAPKNIPVKTPGTTWTFSSQTRIRDLNSFVVKVVIIKLRSFPCGCFCCCLMLRILWGKWMECSSAVVLNVLFFGLGKFSLVKCFLSFWWWQRLFVSLECLKEHWWISSCGVGKQLFRFFEAWRCSKEVLLSNHEAFSKGKRGILGAWRNLPVV